MNKTYDVINPEGEYLCTGTGQLMTRGKYAGDMRIQIGIWNDYDRSVKFEWFPPEWCLERGKYNGNLCV